MIIVLATIELHAGTRDAFLTEFRKNLAAVRAENGCIEYIPTVEHGAGLPGQASVEEDLVVVVEKWQDQDALEAHLIAPHMIAYRALVKDYVKRAALQILEPAE